MPNIKKLTLTLTLLIFSILVSTSNFCEAQLRTVYRTTRPTTIYTKLNMQTVLAFDAEIEFTSGNLDLFRIEIDKRADKLTITPLRSGAYANLIVISKNNERFVFRLVEATQGEFDDLVEIKNTPNTTIDDLINICNHRAVDIDPSMGETMKIYDLSSNNVATIKLPKTQIALKRVVVSALLKKTCLWLRLVNRQTPDGYIELTSSKTKPKKDNLWDRYVSKANPTPKVATKKFKPTPLQLGIRIDPDRFTLSNRKIVAVAFTNEKTVLTQGEFTDLYVVLDGCYVDKFLQLSMVLNNVSVNVNINNLGYYQQNFDVYKVSGSGAYQNITIHDYQQQ